MCYRCVCCNRSVLLYIVIRFHELGCSFPVSDIHVFCIIICLLSNDQFLSLCYAWLTFSVRGKKVPASLVDSALLDSEASVLATLDFLGQDGMEDDDNLRYFFKVIDGICLNYIWRLTLRYWLRERNCRTFRVNSECFLVYMFQWWGRWLSCRWGKWSEACKEKAKGNSVYLVFNLSDKCNLSDTIVLHFNNVLELCSSSIIL